MEASCREALLEEIGRKIQRVNRVCRLAKQQQLYRDTAVLTHQTTYAKNGYVFTIVGEFGFQARAVGAVSHACIC